MSAPYRFIAMADGGSRGNPGIAGYGAVVVDTEADLVLAERAEYIGTESNNVAEYRGLIAALEAALELGITELEMRLDSKLVVEQMSGRWKIKHPAMKPLALRAKGLADQLDRVEFVWIPRAENHHADRLANEAMDGGGKKDVAKTVDLTPAAAPNGEAGADAGTDVDAGPGPGRSSGESLLTASPGSAPTLSLVMLRHGETEQSLERRFSGSSDLPLTGKGERQAAAAAERIAASAPFAAIYSSSLQRARQTADAVAKRLGLAVQVEQGLREVGFGDWEGMTFTEAQRAGGDAFSQWAGSVDYAPPGGGESQAACLQRVAGVRNRLLREHAGERILIVTHVTPIKALIGEALGGLGIARRINLDLCSLSRVDYYEGRTVVKLINEVSHLGVL